MLYGKHSCLRTRARRLGAIGTGQGQALMVPPGRHLRHESTAILLSMRSAGVVVGGRWQQLQLQPQRKKQCVDVQPMRVDLLHELHTLWDQHKGRDVERAVKQT